MFFVKIKKVCGEATESQAVVTSRERGRALSSFRWRGVGGASPVRGPLAARERVGRAEGRANRRRCSRRCSLQGAWPRGCDGCVDASSA